MGSNRSIRRHLACLALLAVAGASLACSGTPSADPEAEITFEAVTHQEWEQVVAAHSDGVLVVDMWATWCIPCIERFPHMVELYHEYADQGVEFMSLSFDDRGDAGALERAADFLREQRAVFPNYRLDEDVLEAFDKVDLLTIPAVYIYDRGQLVHRLVSDHPDRQFTDQDVENAIRELIAARG